MPDMTTAPLTLALVAVAGLSAGVDPLRHRHHPRAWVWAICARSARAISAPPMCCAPATSAAALATLLLDAAKGGVAVLIARACWWARMRRNWRGLRAFLGHLYPVWLGFKGGKGVATFLGILLALAWPVGLAACATWAVTAAVSRISSLSALVAAASSTFWMLGLGQGRMMLLGVSSHPVGLHPPCQQHQPSGSIRR